MWSLGCVLHEVTLLRPAFKNDWDVQEYNFSQSNLEIEIAGATRSLVHHVTGCIRNLLEKDRRRRPSAITSQIVFSSYSSIFNDQFLSGLFQLQSSFPLYTELKQLALGHKTQTEILSKIAHCYEKEDKYDELLNLRAKLDDHENIRVCKALIERALGDDLSLRDQLAQNQINMGDHDGAIRTYEEVIQIAPWKFWPWHQLCLLYVFAMEDLKGAIEICLSAGRKNPAAMIELSNLYALSGNYGAAVSTSMEAFDSGMIGGGSFWPELLKSAYPPGRDPTAKGLALSTAA